MVAESLRAAEVLQRHGISVEVIAQRCYIGTVCSLLLQSVAKTKKIIVADTAQYSFSNAQRLILHLLKEYPDLINSYQILAMPDIPEPTSYHLTKHFYLNAHSLVTSVCSLLEVDSSPILSDLNVPTHHDVPGPWFSGPF